MKKHLFNYIVEMYGQSAPSVWWRWRLKTCNGRIIAHSVDVYSNRTVCRNVCEPLATSNDMKFIEYKKLPKDLREDTKCLSG